MDEHSHWQPGSQTKLPKTDLQQFLQIDSKLPYDKAAQSSFEYSCMKQVSPVDFSDDLDYLKQISNKSDSFSSYDEQNKQTLTFHHIEGQNNQTDLPLKTELIEIDSKISVDFNSEYSDSSVNSDFQSKEDDIQGSFSYSQDDSYSESNNSQGTFDSKNNCTLKCNTSKKATNTVKVSKSNDAIQKKSIGPSCGNCRFKCQSKVTVADRQIVFEEFSRIGNRAKQWIYLDSLIKTKMLQDKKQNSGDKQRKISREFFITVSGTKVKVCRKMFLNTFGISHKTLDTIDKKKNSSETGQIIGNDMRGKHGNRRKKTPDVMLQSIRNHIDSFPKKESNYCGNNSTRQYLDENLNITLMYEKYITWMKSRNDEANIASEYRYKYVFYHEYNLSFQRPKKDQCDECAAFYSLPSDQQQEPSIQERHSLHLRNENTMREKIWEDRNEAQENPHILCASFDLQNVNIPHTEASALYCKGKLSIYNFTAYNLDNKEAECFIWNETTAKRGANEIASCIWKYIANQNARGKTDFRFYGDNCGGQMRNQILFSMYAKAATDLAVKITHRYLVKGHTESSKDSIHSVIENAAKHLSIFTQEEWCNIIKEAKSEEPKHLVHEMVQEEIFDFSAISVKKFWKNIPISTLTQIEIYPNKTLKCIYNYNEFNHSFIKYDDKIQLTKCYSSMLPLDSHKIQDFCALMNKQLIPSKYHEFYSKLIN